MTTKEWTTDEILERLDILLRKLDAEGMHVMVNTVWLAIEEIKRLKAAEANRA